MRSVWSTAGTTTSTEPPRARSDARRAAMSAPSSAARPRPQVRSDADDAPALVDEHGVDREAHEEHRDVRGVREEQSLAFAQARARDQAEGAAEEVAGDVAALTENGPARDIADAMRRSGLRLPGAAAGRHRGERGGRED